MPATSITVAPMISKRNQAAWMVAVMIKVIAPVGVIFKGTGFHKNDYSGKSGGSSSKPAAETSTTTESTSAGETKSDTKSEAKPADSGGSSSGGGGSDKVA